METEQSRCGDLEARQRRASGQACTAHPWGDSSQPLPLLSGSFDDISNQLRSMLDAIHGEQFFGTGTRKGWEPRINVYEVPDRYLVCVELAGMPREQIDIRAEPGLLLIRGTRSKPALPVERSNIGVHVMEIDSGRFHRKIPLPSDVLIDQVTARYRDGYLWIDLKRTPQSEETSSL